jgi:hypothetical protein
MLSSTGSIEQQQQQDIFEAHDPQGNVGPLMGSLDWQYAR